VVSCVTSLKSRAAKRSKTVANLRVKLRLMRDNFEARKPLRKINGPEFPFWNCSLFARACGNRHVVTQSLMHRTVKMIGGNCLRSRDRNIEIESGDFQSSTRRSLRMMKFFCSHRAQR